jgi:hypothetical protein
MHAFRDTLVMAKLRSLRHTIRSLDTIITGDYANRLMLLVCMCLVVHLVPVRVLSTY